MDTHDLKKVPIGQTVTVVDTQSIRSTFHRDNENGGTFQQFDPLTGKAVWRSYVDLNGGKQSQTWFDAAFWRVLVDGKPAGAAGTAQGDVSFDANTRTVNITTR